MHLSHAHITKTSMNQPSQDQIDIATTVLLYFSENKQDLGLQQMRPLREALGSLINPYNRRSKLLKNVAPLDEADCLSKVELKKVCCELKRNKLGEKDVVNSQLTQKNQQQLSIASLPLKQRRKMQQQYQLPPSENGFQLHTEELEQLRNNNKSTSRCYICKQTFQKLHHFYDQLCPDCGDINFSKRSQRCNLQGKVALVTGGRIKIGYQIALILLRNGCHTVVTSRFPKDTVNRFQSESDFEEFKSRLEIYGVDFKFSPSIKEFCIHMRNKYSRLDILINNAAQTIRKEAILNSNVICAEFTTKIDSQTLPKDFLNESLNDFLLANKDTLVLPQQLQFSSIDHVSRSALVSLINIEHVQDVKLVIDANKELVDLRAKNSWTMELDQVGLSEFMEVYFINAAAPFMLCSLLKPMMSNPSFIVNVSAVEGQFYRSFKNSTHPHTNMAKAALNMMTRTCGSYYSNSGIYMNAADTGWVTDENPLSFTRGITVPLDEVDGAMRVLDCVFEGYNNQNYQHSRFFKDYKETFW